MSPSVSEKDWKIFRELREVALQRLCEEILDEVRGEMGREAKSPHEKYIEVYKLIRERDKDIARGFDEFSRSAAVRKIGILYSMGLFTDEEFRRFSPEVVQRIELLYGPEPDDEHAGAAFTHPLRAKEDS